jgi:hypothetical protein
MYTARRGALSSNSFTVSSIDWDPGRNANVHPFASAVIRVMRRIYLDYNASTPIEPRVAEVMRAALDGANDGGQVVRQSTT